MNKSRILDDKEIELIREAVGFGYNTRSIARAMNISQRTVVRVKNRLDIYR